MPSESRTLAVSPQTCVSRFLAPQGGSFCGNGGILTSFPRHCQFADSWVARGYAEINIAGASTLCYKLHLESRSSDELRLAQLNEVLEDSAKYDSACLVILAGDLNLDASKPGIAGALARAGFRDTVPTARLATTPARHLLEAGRHIDSAFVRGPGEADARKVHRSVGASDHYPISFELRLPG